MRCPYCKVKEAKCVPDIVYIHTEAYGGGVRHFYCKTCKKVVKATVIVEVIIHSEAKTDEPSDW